MKRLLIVVLIAVCSIAQAQVDRSLHFGLKAAPSLAWLRSDTKGYDSNGSKFGFSYGLITEFNFADNYAFATGIDITYRGGKFKSVESESIKDMNNLDSIVITTSTSSSYTIQYIELPITLKLKTNEIGYLTYFLQAGVAPGINIRARKSFTADIQTTPVGGSTASSSAEGDKIDVQDDINRFNLSMIIGGGVEYTLSGHTVFLGGIQFNNGFLDVFDNDAKVNSNYLALTLAVLF